MMTPEQWNNLLLWEQEKTKNDLPLIMPDFSIHQKKPSTVEEDQITQEQEVELLKERGEDDKGVINGTAQGEKGERMSIATQASSTESSVSEAINKGMDQLIVTPKNALPSRTSNKINNKINDKPSQIVSEQIGKQDEKFNQIIQIVGKHSDLHTNALASIKELMKGVCYFIKSKIAG